ncbi:MAG TPA: insulinase family protein [Candidatus Fimenecus excrementavium]|nr:insulinase family protein [Candidatus Fimenecus excrementavium]
MPDIREVKSERLGESYFEIDHPSGLKILVYPKKNYAATYAVFGTRYGSIDTEFRLNGEEKFTCVPEGIAHFLEHKLFESEDLDAFERYAKTGASANAYTSFDKTCYLFSCTGKFQESLEILLDFVTHPYFTEKTVQKEQGIIGQEIQMCRDEAGWEALFSLLRAMYKTHPVRIDIAGTVESIAEITPELLYKCYETFYNFSNMVLCVAGNVTPDEVLSVADRLLKPQKPIEIERKFHREPREVAESYTEETLSVAFPIFSLGFKEAVETPERSLREILISDIILEAVAGKTSAFYSELLEAGLINTSFESEYFCGYGYAAWIFTGESPDGREVQKRITARIRALQESGISKADFERIRKKLYGRSIMQFNDIDGIANAMVSAYFCKEGLFDETEILQSLTLDEVNARLRTALQTDCASLSVIKPEGE